uniref:Methyltransferase domain-containing protein n=1 Tax=Romanomermis culicivorax TaxID=13658 RepID=A0A915K023_ROMCU
ASKRHTNVSKHWPSIIKRLDLQKLNGNGKYTPLKRLIDHRTINLDDIVSFENGDTNRDVLICGLHTCGDLASNSMEIFLQNRQAKVLCLISCCYHLIEEQFSSNPFR